MPSAPSACKNPKMGSKPADVLIRVPTGVAKGVLLLVLHTRISFCSRPIPRCGQPSTITSPHLTASCWESSTVACTVLQAVVARPHAGGPGRDRTSQGSPAPTRRPADSAVG